MAGHILAFYGKMTNPRASLPHDQAVIASKAIINIPTWMGYFARWRVRCMSISEASEIVAGCKRLEKENWRQAHWELQNRFSALHSLPPPDHSNLRPLRRPPERMMGLKLTLPGVDGQGVVQLHALQLAHL